LIVQIVMNMLRDIGVMIVGLIPPLPPEVSAQLAQLAPAGAFVSGLASKFGVLIPWSVTGPMFVVWLSLFGVWFAFSVVSLIRRVIQALP